MCNKRFIRINNSDTLFSGRTSFSNMLFYFIRKSETLSKELNFPRIEFILSWNAECIDRLFLWQVCTDNIYEEAEDLNVTLSDTQL